MTDLPAHYVVLARNFIGAQFEVMLVLNKLTKQMERVVRLRKQQWWKTKRERNDYQL